MSNVFNEIIAEHHANDFKLGLPSTDVGHRDRRLALMRHLTGGNGFRQSAKEIATRADGTTRGDRKRKARAAADAKVNEIRPYLHMHSAARRRVLALEVAA